jgi:hypothetical protein
MLDAGYLTRRAREELEAAMRAPDQRVRRIHLELADAYAFRLSEARRAAVMASNLEVHSAA